MEKRDGEERWRREIEREMEERDEIFNEHPRRTIDTKRMRRIWSHTYMRLTTHLLDTIDYT